MMDRGMIKWQPFSAVAPGSTLVNDVLSKKNIVKMPTLSEDQLLSIEKKIFSSFQNQEILEILYFCAGRYYLVKGVVTKIDTNTHKIILNDKKGLFFSQIIRIS